MTKLDEFTEALNIIFDRIKKNNSGIKLELTLYDFQILFNFEAIYFNNDFRKAISIYRIKYGKEELNEELKLIIKSAKLISNFYLINQKTIDQIGIYKLLSEKLNYLKLPVDIAYEELKKISYELTLINGKIESMSWKVSMESSEMKVLLLTKINIKEEFKILEKEYQECLDEYNKQFNIESRFSKFSSAFEKLTDLIAIIESNYLQPNKIFEKMISEDSLEFLNELFEPSFDKSSAIDFLNTYGNSHLPVRIKYRKEASVMYLIYRVSELIKDEKLKMLWVNAKCKALNIKKSTYDKKRTTGNTAKLIKWTEKIVNDLK